MKYVYFFFVPVLFLGCITQTFAQTQAKYSGWLAIYHSQKISGKWGYTTDAQYRSANQFSKISAF